MSTPNRLARVAGLLYLILAVCGGWSELYVRSRVRVPGDAAATAQNIADSARLFRIAFAADLVNITCFLLVALTLYALLKHIDANVAVAMVVFNAVTVAIMSVNMLNHAGALLAATNADVSAAFGAESSRGLAFLFLDMHSRGYAIAQIFFGLWLLPLGYLVFKSGYFPRVLGVFLMVGCGGYLGAVAVSFLFPGVGDNVHMVAAMTAGVSEMAFLLWLLVKGVRVPSQGEHAAAARLP